MTPSKKPKEEASQAEEKAMLDEQASTVESKQSQDQTEQIEPESIESEDPQVLKAELAKAQAESQEYLEGWQRARAELANYRKRVDRDRQEQYGRIVADILARYLAVMDDFERALHNRPQEGEGAVWAEGIAMIYAKLKSILDAEGVKPIASERDPFDPYYHEAISQEQSEEHAEGEIIEVVQQGYQMGDRVIRPAMVRVAK